MNRNVIQAKLQKIMISPISVNTILGIWLTLFLFSCDSNYELEGTGGIDGIEGKMSVADQSFSWKKANGDFAFTGFFNQNYGTGMGLMVRESLEKDAFFASMVLAEPNVLHFTRLVNGEAKTSIITLPEGTPPFAAFRLEKLGNQLTAQYALQNQPFARLAGTKLSGSKEVFAGILHKEGIHSAFNFWRFSHLLPLKSKELPLDRLISRVETIDRETGVRKIVYEGEGYYESPDWLNENTLVFTQNDERFQINTTDGSVQAFNEELEPVYKFDQQVSPNDDEMRLLSHNSNDGKGIDIYMSQVGSEEEIRLTDSLGRDDSPVFSPDGTHVYFNTERIGVSEIWRMKADGSEQMGLTFDGYQDWFPHPSPDGRWLAFLTFDPRIPSNETPACQPVQLRMLDMDGERKPLTLTHFVGGIGSLGKSCWSTDGKQIVFISHVVLPEGIAPQKEQ